MGISFVDSDSLVSALRDRGSRPNITDLVHDTSPETMTLNEVNAVIPDEFSEAGTPQVSGGGEAGAESPYAAPVGSTMF